MLGSKLLQKGPFCLWTLEKPGNSFPLPGPCAIRAAYSRVPSVIGVWSSDSKGDWWEEPGPALGGRGGAVILMIFDTLCSRGLLLAADVHGVLMIRQALFNNPSEREPSSSPFFT